MDKHRKNKKLTELKNIGTKLAARLNEIGIFSADELRFHGAAHAHRELKEKYPDETLAVCYYLYSFEGAITDTHWNDIPEARKKELQAEIN